MSPQTSTSPLPAPPAPPGTGPRSQRPTARASRAWPRCAASRARAWPRAAMLAGRALGRAGGIPSRPCGSPRARGARAQWSRGWTGPWRRRSRGRARSRPPPSRSPRLAQTSRRHPPGPACCPTRHSRRSATCFSPRLGGRTMTFLTRKAGGIWEKTSCSARRRGSWCRCRCSTPKRRRRRRRTTAAVSATPTHPPCSLSRAL
mmetsp:Transcript_18775/g.53049  ORF Transcript_18775/g.53049 Transcript_18775/m.53049 type:complete len:203 (-) Transcript_18775:282-890(-)